MAGSLIAKVVGWIKAGYPDGVAPQDFPSVLLVLQRHLTDDDLIVIAEDLVITSITGGAQPITGEDIRAAVRAHARQSAEDEDVRRVSAVLAQGGWPLSYELL
jgi:hypothetical protein